MYIIYKYSGVGEDHIYCVPILASLIENQYKHCIEKKEQIHILRSDGMEKNKNIAIKVIDLLREKYRNNIINSTIGENYILLNEKNEELKIDRHIDAVPMRLRVCILYIIVYF